jgi:hypothetical protein
MKRKYCLWVFAAVLIASDAVGQIHVTGRVEDIQLCSLDKQEANVFITVRLKIKNLGTQRIIVYKSTIVSGDALTTSTAKPQEREWSHSEWMVVKSKRAEDIPDKPSAGFAILEQRNQVEVSLHDRIFGSLPELRHARYLHLRLFNPWSEKEIAAMESKWAEYGNLWRGDLSPEPIPFKFPAKPQVVQCPQ